MLVSSTRTARIAAAIVVLGVGFLASSASAAVLKAEDFNTVTVTGGGVFLDGRGGTGFVDWDNGIVGETAFGYTTLHANVRMSAQGNTSSGVSGSGAGELRVEDVHFDMLDEDFSGATGTGAWVLIGDANAPAINNAGNDNFDDGLFNEAAYFGTYNGAGLTGAVVAESTAGAGRIDVSGVELNSGNWYGGMTWTVGAFPSGSAAVLHNGGFDADGDMPFGGDLNPESWTLGGDAWWLQGPPSWNGNTYVEGSGGPTPINGDHTLKMWCAWWAGIPNDSYVYQDLPATEGQTWEIDCFAQHMAGDALAGPNYGYIAIEFFDPNGTLLDSQSLKVVDSNSPTSTWLDSPGLPLTAPANTSVARALVGYINPAAHTGNCGAAFFDNVTFKVISGAPAFDYANFSLSAKVRGAADTGAGEALGHYQLRIEDSAGYRLAFPSVAVADPNWTTIGGTLDTAVELDPNENPVSGQFNPGSNNFKVVVAYDNARSSGTWGTGGVFEVDDLLMPNTNPAGSQYVGGLFWDELPAPTEVDPRNLTLTADVLGDVVGGAYELRFEGYSEIPCVDQDFDGVTGTGGGLIVGPGGVGAGVDNWDNGIDYETGFAGLENAVVTSTGGIWIQGETSGGVGNSGKAVIEAHEIAVNVDGKWFAGISWAGQALASTDLSTVTLTADIKGEWDPNLLESSGTYQLRIEDPDGDYIGWDMMANGGWQSVGGALSTCTASGATAGGDGIFLADTESEYTVVIVLEGTLSNWVWGGKLSIDNVSLSPCPDPVDVYRGQISFTGVADGTYQTIGGLLSDGVSTWPAIGGTQYDEYRENWDRGISGEAGFYGGYLATQDPIWIGGCEDCGVGGTGSGKIVLSNIVHQDPGGVYWAGSSWHDLAVDMSDPTKVRISGDVKGEWDTGDPNSVAGRIVIRLEDGLEHELEFTSAPVNGTWMTLGGTMNTATLGRGPFDYNTGNYHFTVIMATHDFHEGPNATVWFDNLKLEYNPDPIGNPTGWTTIFAEDFDTVAGPTPGFLDDAGPLDNYTLTLTMENAVATWGASGVLTIDNLNFEEGSPTVCVGDVGGAGGCGVPDGSVDLTDLGCLLGDYGSPSLSGVGDIGGAGGCTVPDGNTDLTDLGCLLGAYGPCP